MQNSTMFDGMKLVPRRRGRRTNATAEASAVHVPAVETSNMFQELACCSLTPDVLFGATPGPAEEAMSGSTYYSPQPPHGGVHCSSSVRSRSVPVRVTVPVFLPKHALVMNAAKKLQRARGPR